MSDQISTCMSCISLQLYFIGDFLIHSAHNLCEQPSSGTVRLTVKLVSDNGHCSRGTLHRDTSDLQNVMPKPKLLGVYAAEFLRPFTHSFIGKNHATHSHHFFNIAVAQSKTKIQPHAITDDFSGSGDITILMGSCPDRIA